uniref:Uncharacterized protein n=1 Tax=Anguilla anguilla TaxID=7936 RepID=A0A0E9S1K1_ANGAN
MAFKLCSPHFCVHLVRQT